MDTPTPPADAPSSRPPGALLPKDVPEGRMLRAWLDNWTGIGHVPTGMARQGYDLALTSYGGKDWRATFHVMGREHAPAARPSAER